MKFAGPASPAVLNGYTPTAYSSAYTEATQETSSCWTTKVASDEACFGDLAAYEARSQGLVGVVIWGRHRDSAEVEAIGVPLFSYGTYPLGMQQTFPPVEEPFARCQFDEAKVERGDFVFADDDGVLFVSKDSIESVMDTAEEIQIAEQAQVAKICAGTTLREQLQFDRYLREKKTNPTLTLGEHMKKIGRHF